MTELRDLLGRFDVAFEQGYSAELKLPRERSDFGSDRRAGEAADQKLTDFTSHRQGHEVI